MVRTKANASSVRISAAKAPRKYSTPVSHSSAGVQSPSSKKEKSVGGNPACPRPTPVWQKPVTSFFNPVPKHSSQELPDNQKMPEPEPVEKTSDETSSELFHDDKENRNPQDSVATPKEDKSDDEPGPSHRGDSKTKRRRILTVDSDSEEEAKSKSHGCVAEIEDEITMS